MRAEARGPGEGILGWHRKAISAYTWCATEKGPQKKWLHFVKKADTPECRCPAEQIQSGEHLVERCSLLTEERGRVKKELGAWKTRYIQKQPEKKKKGPVEPEKEKEKEKDEMEDFFCQIHEFLIPTPAPAVFVQAALPPRYAINFVPANVHVSASPSPYPVVSSPNFVVPPCTDFSVVSSANFVPASVFTSSSCIGTIQ